MNVGGHSHHVLRHFHGISTHNFMQGDHPMSAVGGPTKRAALMADMGADHSHVPASWPPEAARLEKAGPLRQQD